MTRRRRRRKGTAPGDSVAQVPGADVARLMDVLRVIARGLGAVALRLAPSKIKKTDRSRIQFLQALGLDRNEIAGILGTTPATVSVRLSESRTRTSGRRRRRATG